MITQDQLIYHRGRHGVGGVLPNTTEAFLLAAKDASFVEMDVHDGCRIAHDVPFENSPTLEGILRSIDGKCKIVIDLKSPRTMMDLIATLRRAVRSGLYRPDMFTVSSFHHASLTCIKALQSNLRVGALMNCVPSPEYIAQLQEQGIDQLHVDWQNVLMDADGGYKMLLAAKACLMPIWAYTVNDKATAEKMLDYGVERIFTDRPDVLLNIHEPRR